MTDEGYANNKLVRCDCYATEKERGTAESNKQKAENITKKRHGKSVGYILDFDPHEERGEQELRKLNVMEGYMSIT